MARTIAEGPNAELIAAKVASTAEAIRKHESTKAAIKAKAKGKG